MYQRHPICSLVLYQNDWVEVEVRCIAVFEDLSEFFSVDRSRVSRRIYNV